MAVSSHATKTLRWVALVLLCVVVVGCGGGVSTETLNEAAEATRALEAAEIGVIGSVTLGADAIGAFEATGQANLADGEHVLDVTSAPTGVDPFSVDVIVADGAIYQRGLPGVVPGRWLRIDGAPPAISADLPTFVDPVSIIRLVEGLAGTVTDLGEERLRGVDTRRVRVVLPPARMVRRITQVIEGVAPELLEEIDREGRITAQAVAELWIDGDQLIRQLRLETEAGVGEGRAIPGVGAIDNEVILRVDPVATPVEVEPPPSEDVARARFADLFPASEVETAS